MPTLATTPGLGARVVAAPLVLLPLLFTSAPAEAQDGRRVKVFKVKAEDIDRRSMLQGEVLALETMRLVPRVAGYVQKIHVREGALVDGGTTLVTLDSPDLVRERQVADAMVKKAQALQDVASNAVKASQQARVVADADEVAATSKKLVAGVAVQVAEANYRRVKNLREQRAATDEEWEEAQLTKSRGEAELEAAKSAASAAKARIGEAVANIALREAELSGATAGVAVALAQAEQAKVFVGFATLENPYPKARVTRQFVDAGTLAMANTTEILEVMNISKVRIRFGIPRGEAPFVRPGSKATIIIPNSPQRIASTVTRVTGALTTTSRTMFAEIELDNADGKWMPGSLFNVDLQVRKVTGALVIPIRAVTNSRSREGERQAHVWVVRGGKANEVSIATGIRMGRRVQILTGLAAGDQVIVAGFIGLNEGDPVRTEVVTK